MTDLSVVSEEPAPLRVVSQAPAPLSVVSNAPAALAVVAHQPAPADRSAGMGSQGGASLAGLKQHFDKDIKDASDRMDRGDANLVKPGKTLAGTLRNKVVGVGQEGLGALDAVFAPAQSVVQEELGDPVQRLTGGAVPSDTATDIAMAVPAVPSAIRGLTAAGKGVSKLFDKTPEAIHDLRQSIFDQADSLRATKEANAAEAFNTAKTLPEWSKNAGFQEDLYHHGEDPDSPATANVKDYFAKHLEPLRTEARETYQRIQQAKGKMPMEGDEDFEPLVESENRNYMPQIAQGKGHAFDEGADIVSAKENPLGSSPSPRSIAQNTNATRARSYYALEDAAGNRKLIQVSPDKSGFEIVGSKGVGHEAPDGIALGKPYKDVNGKDWTVRRATVKEKEAAIPGTQYYKNAAASLIETRRQLKNTEANVAFFNNLKSELVDNDVMVGPNREVPKGWRKANGIPVLDGYYFEPKIANALEKVAGTGPEKSPFQKSMTKVNDVLLHALYINPLPHIHNVAVDSFIGRGWDNFKPMANVKLAGHLAKSFQDVKDMGPTMQEILRNGGSLMYPSSGMKNLTAKVFQDLSRNMEDEPKAWDKVAKSLGMDDRRNLLGKIMDKSSNAMWFSNDVMYQARYRELRAKGMDPKTAIQNIEKHFVNYKVPDRILGSEALGDLMTNRSYTLFGRYHYGRVRAVMNTLKDLGSGDPEKMIDATGQLAATAVLLGVLYPAADEIVQHVTGNKNASIRRAGVAGLLDTASKVTQGDKPPLSLSEAVVSPSPELTIPAELMSNKNLFTGQDIVGRGNTGSDKAMEMGDYALSKVPLANDAMAAITEAKKNGKGKGAGDFAANLLDVKTPLPDAKDKQAKGKKYGNQETARRDKKLREKYDLDQ